MIDIPSFLATLGFSLLIGSSIPQLYSNFKTRYTGNQRLLFYSMLVIGTSFLFPSISLSGRFDLYWGTLANIASEVALLLSVMLFRRNKHPKNVYPKTKPSLEENPNPCKNCGHSIGWHRSHRRFNENVTLTSKMYMYKPVGCTYEDCDCTWVWCVEHGTCPKQNGDEIECPDPHNNEPGHYGPKNNCGMCYPFPGGGLS